MSRHKKHKSKKKYIQKEYHHKTILKDDYEYIQSLNPCDVQNVFHMAKHRVLKTLWKKRQQKAIQIA